MNLVIQQTKSQRTTKKYKSTKTILFLDLSLNIFLGAYIAFSNIMVFESYPNLFVYVSFCFSHTISLLLLLQNKHQIEGDGNKKFHHPLFQGMVMVAGQSLCLIVFLFKKQQKKEQEQKNDKPSLPYIHYLALSTLDILIIFLVCLGLSNVSGSLFSVASSSSVVIATAFFAKVIMNQNPNKFQILGCLFAIGGVIIASFGQTFDEQVQKREGGMLFGVIMVILAFALQGLNAVYTQLIVEEYSDSEQKLVGGIGLVSTLLMAFLFVIVAFFGCPFESSQCVKDQYGIQRIDSFSTSIADITSDSWFIITAIALVLSMGRYNYDIVMVLKYSSSMVFVILSICINGLIWLSGIIITLIGRGDSRYQIESLDYRTILLKLVGYILCALGLLVYNQVICAQEKEFAEIQS